MDREFLVSSSAAVAATHNTSGKETALYLPPSLLNCKEGVAQSRAHAHERND